MGDSEGSGLGFMLIVSISVCVSVCMSACACMCMRAGAHTYLHLHLHLPCNESGLGQGERGGSEPQSGASTRVPTPRRLSPFPGDAGSISRSSCIVLPSSLSRSSPTALALVPALGTLCPFTLTYISQLNFPSRRSAAAASRSLGHPRVCQPHGG